MEGNLVGSDEQNVRGETTFGWLPGGSSSSSAPGSTSSASSSTSLELIGYDPETDTFPSTVFSGFSPTPLPYRWDVRDDGCGNADRLPAPALHIRVRDEAWRTSSY
jgi:hypothetical protein